MSEAMHPAQVQGAPAFPQVNLLPESVRAKHKITVIRVWLLLVVLVVIFAVTMAGWVMAQVRVVAESDLLDVQMRNDSLRLEKNDYAAAPKLLSEVKDLEYARSLGMSTEVLWSDYLAAISSVTPLEVSIDAISVTQDTAFTGSQTLSYTPLSTAGTVGLVTLNGRALTLKAISDWEEGLAGVTGIADVEVTSVKITDQEGSVYYAVGATFRLTPDAFANQFATEQ